MSTSLSCSRLVDGRSSRAVQSSSSNPRACCSAQPGHSSSSSRAAPTCPRQLQGSSSGPHHRSSPSTAASQTRLLSWVGTSTRCGASITATAGTRWDRGLNGADVLVAFGASAWLGCKPTKPSGPPLLGVLGGLRQTNGCSSERSAGRRLNVHVAGGLVADTHPARCLLPSCCCSSGMQTTSYQCICITKLCYNYSLFVINRASWRASL